MSRRIERDKWSEASKRSYAYYHGRSEYEDISYICRKCSTEAVFTGEQQKESYEVKKNYIWQHRSLCASCNAKLHKLKVKNAALQERWANEKASLQQNPAFMAEWLAVIGEFPSFGSRIGGAMGEKLKKLLAREPDAAPKRTPGGAA